MSRSSREIPRGLADFGERQFRETGAQAVEVLRVKASTIRKEWANLRGISFLVSVIESDRVRVYFFNEAGVMLIAENIEHKRYSKIRTTSKLLRKFEKPRPPTELELRMEATEEVRNALSKSMKKIARFLNVKEPEFPIIYVIPVQEPLQSQSFGLTIGEDGSHLFHDKMIGSSLFEGLTLRSAFLALLNKDHSTEEYSSCIGNAIASHFLKGENGKQWDKKWIENSKTSSLGPIAFHLMQHIETYWPNGFRRILEILETAPAKISPTQWIAVLDMLHSSFEVTLGTESWFTIDGFIKTLSKPKRLVLRHHALDAIHLAPRILCNPVPLGISLGLELSENSSSEKADWLRLDYQESTSRRYLEVCESRGSTITSIDYFLRLSDILPKTGGIYTSGKDIVRWALKILGHSLPKDAVYETSLQMEPKKISEAEKAVLERLCSGKLDVISNTLIGSPERVESLIASGCIALLPDFAHLGINSNLLLISSDQAIMKRIEEHVLEATIFNTEKAKYAILSAPSIWYNRFLQTINSDEMVFPIINISSTRNLVRCEIAFQDRVIPKWASHSATS
ncbi:MAG: hypothetical protein ACFFEF_04725 [Candidatus Thorarchaeota archaeon]